MLDPVCSIACSRSQSRRLEDHRVSGEGDEMSIARPRERRSIETSLNVCG